MSCFLKSPTINDARKISDWEARICEEGFNGFQEPVALSSSITTLAALRELKRVEVAAV